MNFDESLKKLGEPGEILVVELLRKYDNVLPKAVRAKRVEGRAGYDIFAGIYIPVEVKNDNKAGETGNLFIEVYNPKMKELSGISSTKSYTYVILQLNSSGGFKNPIAHFFRSAALRQMLCANKVEFKEKYWKANSGNNNSNGYTLPIHILKEKLPKSEDYCQVELSQEDVEFYKKNAFTKKK